MSITLTKTSELDRQFNISKNTRVNRLAMLGLTPDRLKKEGKFYYLSQEQLDLFVDFDKYILETGSTEGYPKLVSRYSDVVPDLKIEDFEDDKGELVAAGKSGIDRKIPMAELNGATVCSIDTDLFTMGMTGEFTESLPNYETNNLLTQHLIDNAQRRATAMILAESALAQQYLNNPAMLDPQLRAQVDSFQYSKIDPKGLAASLVATAQRRMTAA
jgi:hypothetical protein